MKEMKVFMCGVMNSEENKKEHFRKQGCDMEA